MPLSRNLAALTSWNPLGLSRHVMGLLDLLIWESHGPVSGLGVCRHDRSHESICPVTATDPVWKAPIRGLTPLLSTYAGLPTVRISILVCCCRVHTELDWLDSKQKLDYSFPSCPYFLRGLRSFPFSRYQEDEAEKQ